MRRLQSLAFENKRALIRVDFNVPLSDDRSIIDDSRIRAALPTIEHVCDQGGACVLMSHLGRPSGEPDEALRLAPVVERLVDLLPDRRVKGCEEVVGGRVVRMTGELNPGQILLIENLRFNPGEEDDDQSFAEQLARLGDVYVNDAFAACHREHASVHAVPRLFAADARGTGLLVEREIQALDQVLEDPARPLVALFGGAKVSDKLDTVRALLSHADRVLIGGAMSYTFMKAAGRGVGDSRVEDDHLEVARQILDEAGERLWLPVDHVVRHPEQGENERFFARDDIQDGMIGLDIGPGTAFRYQQEIRRAKTIVWNGPMGKIEEEAFLEGTRLIAREIADADVTSIVGGGETGEVVRRLGLEDRMTFVSTGGGAFLEYMAHGTLPALEVLRPD